MAEVAVPSPLGVNADLSLSASVHPEQEIEWTASPKGGVWRKRLFHTGGKESGRVTSIVRFDAGSTFREHPHPEGEEIFVLTGVFSDWRGDHKAGTYLLNPEGFKHAPTSHEGCEVLVRLRQYPGERRPQIALDTTQIEWLERDAGIADKILFHHPDESQWPETTVLRRLDASSPLHLDVHHYGWAYENGVGNADTCVAPVGGLEVFVVSGTLVEHTGNGEETVAHPTRSWLRDPSGSGRKLAAGSDGCTLLLRVGGMSLAKQL